MDQLRSYFFDATPKSAAPSPGVKPASAQGSQDRKFDFDSQLHRDSRRTRSSVPHAAPNRVSRNQQFRADAASDSQQNLDQNQTQPVSFDRYLNSTDAVATEEPTIDNEPQAVSSDLAFAANVDIRVPTKNSVEAAESASPAEPTQGSLPLQELTPALGKVTHQSEDSPRPSESASSSITENGKTPTSDPVALLRPTAAFQAVEPTVAATSTFAPKTVPVSTNPSNIKLDSENTSFSSSNNELTVNSELTNTSAIVDAAALADASFSSRISERAVASDLIDSGSLKDTAGLEDAAVTIANRDGLADASPIPKLVAETMSQISAVSQASAVSQVRAVDQDATVAQDSTVGLPEIRSRGNKSQVEKQGLPALPTLAGNRDDLLTITENSGAALESTHPESVVSRNSNGNSDQSRHSNSENALRTYSKNDNESASRLASTESASEFDTQLQDLLLTKSKQLQLESVKATTNSEANFPTLQSLAESLGYDSTIQTSSDSNSNSPGLMSSLNSNNLLVNSPTLDATAPALSQLGAGTATSIIEQVIDRLDMDAVSASGDSKRQLSIEIHPAELGRLEIYIGSDDDILNARIVASEVATSELLIREKMHLVNALRELGIDLPDVNISHQDPRDQSQQSFHSQRRETKQNYQQNRSGSQESEPILQSPTVRNSDSTIDLVA